MAPEPGWSRRVSVFSQHFTTTNGATSPVIDIGIAECAASQAVLFARPAIDDTAYARPTQYYTKADEPPTFARPTALEDSLRQSHAQTQEDGPRFSRPAADPVHTPKTLPRLRVGKPPTTLSAALPQVATRETRNFFFIEAKLPGVKAGDLQLRLKGKGLVLVGAKSPVASANQPGAKAKPFSASWPLPPSVDSTRISARHKGDRLLIIMPKLL